MILGGFIQSSAGFGYGLFVIPMLLFLGFNLPETVMIVVIGSAIQKITAVSYMRKEVKWREIFPYIGVGHLTLPIGVYLMYRVSFLEQSSVKQVIGFCIVVMLLLQWKGVIKTYKKIPGFWGYIAGAFSGLLNGFANIGGPPLVLWILAHRWSNEKMRVTALAFSLVFVPFQLVAMFFAFGSSLVYPLVKVILLTPAVLFGTWIGLKVGERISKEQLRTYMKLLLLLIGGTSILKPLFG